MKSAWRVDVVGRLGLLDAELAVALGGDERVEGDDVHPERPRARGDELADAAEAEHAERLLVDLDAAELRALPASRGQRRVRLRDVAREREHQRDRVLGRGDDVRLRRVGDDDPALGRGRDVDVVDADARAADDPQVVGALDQLRVELRGRADQDAVVGADPLGELLGATSPSPTSTVEALAQQRRRRSRRSSPRRGRGTAAPRSGHAGARARRPRGTRAARRRRRRRARRRGRAGRAPSRGRRAT